MATYPARKGVIYLSTTGSGVATNVIHMNHWTLNADTDLIETTSFGDLNKTYVQGLPDLKGTFSGFWDDTETKPFTAASSADGCKLYLYPSADIPTKYAAGPAWISSSMDVSVSGAVTISSTFGANGTWDDRDVLHAARTHGRAALGVSPGGDPP
jgi:hypothetical protein